MYPLWGMSRLLAAIRDFEAGGKTPQDFLAAIEKVQGVLHDVVRQTGVPRDASIAEHKAFSKIVRAMKAMYDQSEDIRLELDEWIIDYDDARKT